MPTRRTEPEVIAWDGRRPVYASPRLQDWRRRMREAREALEAAEGTAGEREAWRRYYAVMSE